MRIGAWSAILGVLAIEIAVLALVLALAGGNRLANRLLAGALIVIAGMMTPFVLGYAGAYDAWPGLTFAPFAVPLALGPLLYGHLLALVRARAPGWPHWLAPGAQFAWQAAAFPLPYAAKVRLDDAVISPWIGPLSEAALLVSLAFYGWAAWRLAQGYEAWLRERRRQVAPARRLRWLVAALALLVMARAGYTLFELTVRPLDYFDLFAFYVMLGALGTWLGIESWRATLVPAPPLQPAEDPAPRWLAAIEAEALWCDPALTADGLARKLGTNRAYLSQALAPHGGFAGVIGGARARAVARWIEAGRGEDLLSLALEAGFGSKASFNRAFQDALGTSPSAYRASHRPAKAMLRE